jgi:hypothetical protein
MLESASLLSTAPDASISAISTSNTRPPSLIGRSSAKIPKRPSSSIASGVAEGAPWAMIVIYIFKENHRLSEKTRHRGPRSVVGAANLAAGRRKDRIEQGD